MVGIENYETVPVCLALSVMRFGVMGMDLHMHVRRSV